MARNGTAAQGAEQTGGTVDGTVKSVVFRNDETGFAGPHQNVPEEPIVIKKVHVAAEPAAPQAPAKKE